MMKKLLIFLSCFLPLSFSHGLAQDKGHGVEVRSTSPELLEIEPGKIVSASFLVSNRTRDEEEFYEKLTLPVGWQEIVSDDLPFKLKSGEQRVRIFAFLVPLTSPAGRYSIGYSVRSQRDYFITDEDTLSVVVVPVVKLEIVVEDRPEAVIAGEAYVVKLRLLNRGNSKTDVKLRIESSPDYGLEMEPSEAALEAGEQQTIRIEVKTDEEIKQKLIQILRIQAEAEEPRDTVVSVAQTVAVEIIPKVTGNLDPYHRLPIQVALIAAGQEEKGGFQVELSGRGSLDEEGKRSIDFLFRGPDIQNKGTRGKRDEYRVSYSRENLVLHLGDRSYSLSPLTERFRYGRGLEAKVSRGKFGYGAFYMEGRWQKPKERELGTYLAYQFNERFHVRGNFLGKSKQSSRSGSGHDDEILSILARVKPDETVTLDLEYGVSDCERDGRLKDAAYRINLQGQADQVSYSFEKTYAGPEYFGYYHDVSYTTGTVLFPIHDRLRGNLSYRSYKNNLDLDSSRWVANREKSYRGGVTYRFSFGTSLYFDYEGLIREDRILPADYNYEERAWKLGVGHGFGNLFVNARAERGRFDNRLLATTNDNLERYSLYSHFRPDPGLSLSSYARFGHSSFTSSLERTRSFGFSTSWRIRDNIHLSLEYRKDETGSEENQKREDLFSTISCDLPNDHALVLRGQWSRYGQEKKEFSFFATYTVPLRIPVGKKTSIGVLRGKVYDEETLTKVPIPKVLLRIQDATAMTDENGEFIFPCLEPGTHYLRVDKNSIGLNRVASEKLPIMVEVKGGEKTEIQIGVVTSCKISGMVTVFSGKPKGEFGDQTVTSGDGLFVVGSGEEDDSKGADVSKVRGLSNILVEVRCEEEVLRQLTDQKGRFSFEDLRPGKWTLTVYDHDLPAYHYLEDEQFQFDLKPGQEKDVTVRVLPRLRPIQIIDEGALGQEKK
ncbi:MAG: hypothetical protein WBD64_05900 [Candidatus Zixiibacteriota bacterium]